MNNIVLSTSDPHEASAALAAVSLVLALDDICERLTTIIEDERERPCRRSTAGEIREELYQLLADHGVTHLIDMPK